MKRDSLLVEITTSFYAGVRNAVSYSLRAPAASIFRGEILGNNLGNDFLKSLKNYPKVQQTV
jgi:hypothetical protein